MTDRQLVIKMVQVHPRPSSATWAGIALAIHCWLGIRVTLHVDKGRNYNITCSTETEAKKLLDNFGGFRKGKVVHGNAVDLTL